MSNASPIKKFFAGEIREDSATLDRYSRDASIFSVRPSLVVSPEGVDDLKKLVRFAAQEKRSGKNISLTARSAGTDMTGGPLSESIVVDFESHFKKILAVGDGYAVTEPGVFYRDFEKATLAKDLLLPCYPASRELCTMGGMVANNSGGEKTLAYGKTEDYVEELSIVLADGNEHVVKPLSMNELSIVRNRSDFLGEVYRKVFALVDGNRSALAKAKPAVSKNSAGYYLWNVYDKERGVFDLTKLLVGSQGTLGLFTKIKFRLVRPKFSSRLLLIFLDDLKPLAEVVNSVLAHKPESFESFDDHTFKVAIKFLPAIIKRMNGNLLSLGWKFLPELFMVLRGGVPKLILLAEFTGDNDATAYTKAKTAQDALAPFNLKTRLTATADEAAKYWVFRRESFNLLRQKVRGLRTVPFIDDFVVRPEFLPKFLPELTLILSRYKIIYTVAGHVGDGNFHIIPLMNLKDKESLSIIKELADKVYALVFRYGGTMTGEHNDGLIRSSYLPMMYGSEIINLFEETKRIFDPLGIFNPGKKVGADRDYAWRHISEN